MIRIQERGQNLVTPNLAHGKTTTATCFEHCDGTTCGGFKGGMLREQPEKHG